MSQRILVTGASGFVGAHLVCDLARAGHIVIAGGGSRPFADEVKRVAKESVSIDLTNTSDIRRVIHEINPEVVVHAAAVANPARCEKDPKEAHRINVIGTEQIAECLRDKKSRLYFLSTDLVFDGNKNVGKAFAEGDNPTPRSVYSSTKREAEQLILTRFPFGVVLRCSLVYGAPVGPAAGFLGWIRDGLEQQKQVTLFTDEWRTPIFVNDISRALLQLLSKPSLEAEEERLFHIAGRDRVSRYEFGVQYVKRFGFDPAFLRPALQAEHPTVPPRPADVSLSTERFERRFGVRFCGIREGLDALFAASE